MKLILPALCLLLTFPAFAQVFPQNDPGLVTGIHNGKSNDDPEDVIMNTHPKWKECSVEIVETGADVYRVRVIRRGTIFGARELDEDFPHVKFSFRPGVNSYYYEGKNDRYKLSLHAVQISNERLSVENVSVNPEGDHKRWRSCQTNRQ